MATTNVWHVNRVAVVTIKIHAPVVLPVRPETLVPMENPVPMVEKAKVDHKESGNTKVHRNQLDANNALAVPRDPTVPLVPLELPDPKVNQATVGETVVPAAALPVQPVKPELQAPMVVQVVEATMVPMRLWVAKAPLVEKVKTAAPATLVRMETLALRVIPAPRARLVLPARLADPVKRVPMVNAVPLVNPAVPARMPNIVLAHITRPKHKPESHRPTFERGSIIRDIVLRFSMLVFSAKLSTI